MLRTCSISLALCLFFGSASHAQEIRFNSVPWGSNPAVVRRAMLKGGFTYDSTVAGDQYYRGEINLKKAFIVAAFTPARELVKFVVFVPTAGSEYYNEVREILLKKYGKPTMNFETSATWLSGEGIAGLTIEVTGDLTVVLSYESAAWHAESQRRSAIRNKAL